MTLKTIILLLQTTIFLGSMVHADEESFQNSRTVIAYSNNIDDLGSDFKTGQSRLSNNIEDYQYSSDTLIVKIDDSFYRKALRDLSGHLIYEIRRNNSECFEEIVQETNESKQCAMRFLCTVIKKNGEELLMCPVAMTEGRESFSLIENEIDEFFIQVSIKRPKPMRDYEKTIVDRSPILNVYQTR